ncbi:MAG: hypothetical protein AAB726_00595 [Patescibacteria group bacterium]
MKTEHHWKILVYIFGLLCITVMALNLYFIYKLNKGELFLSLSENSDTEILNQKRAVQKVNEDFEKKATELADFVSAPSVAVDPSI